MTDDNTVDYIAPTEEEAEVVETEVETDEETDVKETPEIFSFAGRQFTSIQEAEKTYKEMQKEATKAKQELKQVQAKIEKEVFKAEFQELDTDEKMNRLAELMLEKEKLEEVVEEEALEPSNDTTEVERFAKRHPILSEYPALAEQFVDLATSEKYRNVRLESIFDSKFKPLIDSLTGKKITVKRTVVGGGETGGLTLEKISAMKPAEYEKNRDAILKFLTKQ